MGPVPGSRSPIPAPPKHAAFHVHGPHSPSRSLHGAEARKRRNSAPVPVCANTPATGTPSRGRNYTAHTVRLPARTEGMRAPTMDRRGVPAPVRPVPSGSHGFSPEPRVRERRHITGALPRRPAPTIAPRRSAPHRAPRARVSRTSYRVSVQGSQRGPGGARGTAAWVQSGRRRLLPEQRWVRLQSQLQVEDVVDDVL